mmetsp:Transcript_46562/g.82160  ORF Transcript_46562/g.82160 Transcript_46562/m.82160 type:complete len:222 (-) Transcript_46562:97-762(-)
MRRGVRDRNRAATRRHDAPHPLTPGRARPRRDPRRLLPQQQLREQLHRRRRGKHAPVCVSEREVHRVVERAEGRVQQRRVLRRRQQRQRGEDGARLEGLQRVLVGALLHPQRVGRRRRRHAEERLRRLAHHTRGGGRARGSFRVQRAYLGANRVVERRGGRRRGDDAQLVHREDCTQQLVPTHVAECGGGRSCEERGHAAEADAAMVEARGARHGLRRGEV